MTPQFHAPKVSPAKAFQAPLGAHAFRPMILEIKGKEPLLRVNPSFTEQFGYDADALGACPILDRIHPEDREDLEHVINSGGYAAARLQTKDGEWIELDWSVRQE